MPECPFITLVEPARPPRNRARRGGGRGCDVGRWSTGISSYRRGVSRLSERNKVLQKVVALLQAHVPEGVRDAPITESTDLSNDLGINSASVVDMVLTLEEVLKLKPGDNYAFKTVGDLVDYVLAQRYVE